MFLTAAANSPALMAGTVELFTPPQLRADVDAPATPATGYGVFT
jgi:hypothetical protein